MTCLNSTGRLTGMTVTTLTPRCAGMPNKVTMYQTGIRSLAQLRQFHQSLFHEAGRRCSGVTIVPRVFRVPNLKEHFPIEEKVASAIVPFILPPAYDKLLGYDPILDLWENLHRTQDAFSSIVMIGYSMPPYDSYAYETLGRLFVQYQQGGEMTSWERRRVPIQLITLADSRQRALESFPFLDPAKTRVWSHEFSPDSLEWVDWGDGAIERQSG